MLDSYIKKPTLEVISAITDRISKLEDEKNQIFEKCVDAIIKGGRFFRKWKPITRDEAIEMIDENEFHRWHYTRNYINRDINKLKTLMLQAQSVNSSQDNFIFLSTDDFRFIFTE